MMRNKRPVQLKSKGNRKAFSIKRLKSAATAISNQHQYESDQQKKVSKITKEFLQTHVHVQCTAEFSQSDDLTFRW